MAEVKMERLKRALELNYEEDVMIDHTSLDVEWLQQAELMRRYATHQAETRRQMDEAKERLDIGKARIEMDARANPDKYGLTKVTESAIQSAILLQSEYQELTQAYIDAKYENDVAIAAVRAVDQKKTSLENLVKLLGTSYFAGPVAPRDLAHEWQKNVKDAKRREQNKNVKIKRCKK